jgi:hypothetical protein
MLKRLKQLWKRRRKTSADHQQPEDAGSVERPSKASIADPDTDKASTDIRPTAEAMPRRVPRKTARDRPPSVTNRHGIRVIKDDVPLDRLFSQHDKDGESPETAGNQPGVVHRQEAGVGDISSIPASRFPKTDRHGIPILSRTDDLSRLFRASPPGGGSSKEDFDRLLEISLGDASPGTLMRRKHEGAPPPRPLSARRRIKRYPRPQRQLDLHGFTAERAAQRADGFIRTAYADRRLTIRIIVGKGLHSENGPVLPDIVEDRLKALKKEGVVLVFKWEKGVKRKSGAVDVYLNSVP